MRLEITLDTIIRSFRARGLHAIRFHKRKLAAGQTLDLEALVDIPVAQAL